MRYSRTFLRAQGSHFHVVSRIVGREFLLGVFEKRVFSKIMRRTEKAAGVQVLTYCLMDNHVHLLLRTESIEKEAISDEELVSRVRALYSKGIAMELEWHLDHWRKEKNAAQVDYWRERYLDRLGNLSEFMRVLKNLFSKWYNKEHGRVGTLWEDRYKIVLVEGSEAVLVKVAAYIDLNPVRAGMVEDPAEYRWSGYGEACGGGSEARRGLVRVTGVSPQRGWRDAGRSYRKWLFVEGAEGAPGTKVGEKKRQAISRERAAAVMEKDGELSVGELLHLRARYWTDGVILGTRDFVNKVFKAQPASVKGKRKSGARRMRGGNWGDGGLFTLRDLKKDVFGSWPKESRVD